MSLLALSNGCALFKPVQAEEHYYLLTAKSLSYVATQGNGRACVVRLLPVEVPDYLQTEDMAVRIGTNQIEFTVYHQWAEPLEAGIRRVIAENLRVSPQIREVLTDEPSPRQEPVYEISAHILACEGNYINGRGFITFGATWEISQSGPQAATLAHGVYYAPLTNWHAGDYGELADQTSQVLNEFSQFLAHTVSEQAMAHSVR
ncbi:MAG TPA: ABC-type transport auxiliary lipoprotein family protein [Verrucomicrobiae bacterium]|nr:ABC-type transport auxiliary lipoprotein family protein [Verrucomicrobiae bacterium]